MLSRDLRNLTLGQLVAMLPWPAHTQLRVRLGNDESAWERTLKDKMDQARDGMMAPLDMPLDTLFQRRDSIGDEEESQERNDGDH